MKFEDLDLNYDLLDALDAMHFSECTPIQEKSIPFALDGHDILAVAQTGTGKTAAYLLPVLNRLADGELPDDTVNCIIMAPTRELAMQIDRQLEGFGYYINASSLAIYGGTDGATFTQQQKSLILGADIVIATPGRLLAHLQLGKVDLSRVSVFILDEADRMLDMGFFDDIMQIVKHLPSDRQTLMFSATMPPKIQTLARNILYKPKEIKLAVSRPAEKIFQRVCFCNEPQKINVIKSLVSELKAGRAIIFAQSKIKVKELDRELRKHGLNLSEMHSDLEQPVRDQVMLDFKSGKKPLLVATDIVARGIDIDDIALVINYEVPHDAEDYVDRRGRPARADADGQSVTLVSDCDRRKWSGIERFLKRRIDRWVIEDSPESEVKSDDKNESTKGKQVKYRKFYHHNKRRKPSQKSD